MYGILYNYLLFTTVRGSELPNGQLIQSLAAKFGEKKCFCQHLVLQVSLRLNTGNQYYWNQCMIMMTNIDASITTVSKKMSMEQKSLRWTKTQYETQLQRQLKTL